MKKKETLSSLRNTAAEILASAVLDLDPKAFALQGGASSSSFFFDFILPEPYSKETLSLIEERMRAIAAADLEVKIHEMIPANAVELMRHHSRPYPAHFITISNQPLVQVLQIGNFVDHVVGTFAQRTSALQFFKVLQIERRPDLHFKGVKKEVYRITGVAEKEKERLKDQVKRAKKGVEIDHLSVAMQLDLLSIELQRDKNYFEIGRIYWKEKGEELLYQIYTQWRAQRRRAGFELITTSGQDKQKSHEIFYKLAGKSCAAAPVKLAEFSPSAVEGFSPIHGLLGAAGGHSDRAHIFCCQKDFLPCLNSCLKFLDKLPKMLGYEYSIEVATPEEYRANFVHLFPQAKLSISREVRVHWKLAGSGGKTWQGPFVTVQKRSETFIIGQSLFPSVERVIALALEGEKKDLSQKKELLGKIAHYDKQDNKT